MYGGVWLDNMEFLIGGLAWRNVISFRIGDTIKVLKYMVAKHKKLVVIYFVVLNKVCKFATPNHVSENNSDVGRINDN